MVRQRIASSVLLTRGSGPELELFLVRRSKRLRFFGGYAAFPGGVVDRGDELDGPDGDGTHRRCALRELFEETGVLAAGLGPGQSRAERETLRRALLDDDDPGNDAWYALLEGVRRASDGVRPFARLTTPPFAPVLYRTRFLHVALPQGEVPEVWPGELDSGEFLRPARILERWLAGELLVAPPVLYLIETLAAAPDLEAFFAAVEGDSARLEAGALHPVRNTPGIVMAPLATPTLPPATTTNCYVVGTRELFVVDPATWEPREQERLFQLLDERCATQGARVAGVLVTHHHRDHVGAVAATSQRYDVPVHAHAETLARLPAGFRPGRALADGARVDLGQAPDGSPDWQLTALFTPGHDRGHLCFLESRYAALLAGDLVSTLSTIVIDPPEGHLATYLASLERVRNAEIGMIYPAHGVPARDGRALLRRYLAHRAEREAALVRGLERGLESRADLARHVYADVDERMLPLAERSLLAGLLKLADEGRAREQSPASDRWRLVEVP